MAKCINVIEIGGYTYKFEPCTNILNDNFNIEDDFYEANNSLDVNDTFFIILAIKSSYDNVELMKIPTNILVEIGKIIYNKSDSKTINQDRKYYDVNIDYIYNYGHD